MKKQNALIIFGGASNEYEISLRSACSIIENIDTNLFTPILLGISRDGGWFYCDCPASDVLADKWQQNAVPAILSPDKTTRGIVVFYDSGAKIINIDVAFPAMHGQSCEDGAIQGLFKLSGIPFVGCSITSSAICFDKVFTHIVAESQGIPMAKWVAAYSTQSIEEINQNIKNTIGYPAFIKSANSGSSVGTAPVKNSEALKDAAAIAFAHDNKVVIEELIVAQEVECAVLGNLETIAPTTAEIVSPDGFYDYDAKYKTNSAKLLIPANISLTAQEQVKEMAQKVYKLLDCRGLSRVDFFVQADGTVLFNEINTLPGFTSISLYPKMMCASGFDYKGLVTKLLELAVEEHNQNGF